MNKRIRLIKKQIDLQNEKLKSLQNELVDAHRCRFLTCARCSKKSLVGKIVGVDVKYLNPNTGSPNGSYWTHDYWAWTCPHCKTYRHNEIEDAMYWEMYSSFQATGAVNQR